MPKRTALNYIAEHACLPQRNRIRTQETLIMATDPARHVTDFCHSLTGGDMARSCSFLAADVHYHNMPWAPVTGHEGVRQVLEPLLQGSGCAMQIMEIEHTVCNGEVVMNARLETWERQGVRLVLPVAGLFIVRDGLITRWVDYWDLATVQPLLDTL